MSRPVKTPTRLRKVWPEELLALRVQRLFAKHGAPASWGIPEAHFLVEHIYKGPPSVSALRHIGRRYRVLASKTGRRDMAAMARHYQSSLDAAPRLAPAMLARFDRLMRTLGAESFAPLLADVGALWTTAFASPEFNLAAELGIRADDPEMWSSTTKELAARFRVTVNVVEHARGFLREALRVSARK